MINLNIKRPLEDPSLSETDLKRLKPWMESDPIPQATEIIASGFSYPNTGRPKSIPPATQINYISSFNYDPNPSWPESLGICRTPIGAAIQSGDPNIRGPFVVLRHIPTQVYNTDPAKHNYTEAYCKRLEKHQFENDFSYDIRKDEEPLISGCNHLRICTYQEPQSKLEVDVVVKKPKDPQCALFEFNVISELEDCPNIVRLVRSPGFLRPHFDPNKGEIHMQLLPPDLWKRGTVHDFAELQIIVYQFLEALEGMKKKGIMHSDLKLNNIAYDPKAKIITLFDFDLARYENEKVHYILTNAECRAPESHFYWRDQTCAIDMWSVGSLVYRLATGKRSFKPPNNGFTSPQDRPNEEIKNSIEYAFVSQMYQLLGTIPSADYFTKKTKNINFFKMFPLSESGDRYIDQFKILNIPSVNRLENRIAHLCKHFTPSQQLSLSDLLRRMLMFDPSMRITPDQALQHPFFDGCPLKTPIPLKKFYSDDDFKESL